LEIPPGSIAINRPTNTLLFALAPVRETGI